MLTSATMTASSLLLVPTGVQTLDAVGISFHNVFLFSSTGSVTQKTDITADNLAAFKDADNKMAFFVTAPVTIVKNFSITPEFSYYDQMKDKTGVDERTDYTVGAKLQMDF